MGQVDAGAEQAGARDISDVRPGRRAARRCRFPASRMATSTAISMASSVVLSSALRKRSFFVVTMAALPRRSTLRVAEIETAVGVEFFQLLRGFGPRQQHGVAKMPAAGFAGEHVGEENALIDLDAVFVALQVLGFGGDLRRASASARARHRLRRTPDLPAGRTASVMGQLVVEARRRGRARKRSRCSRAALENGLGGVRFGRRCARALCGKAAIRSRAEQPERDVAGGRRQNRRCARVQRQSSRDRRALVESGSTSGSRADRVARCHRAVPSQSYQSSAAGRSRAWLCLASARSFPARARARWR